MTDTAVRIVLAEDNFLVREGVRRLLDGVDGFEVVACCDDVHSALAAVDRHAPDVVLTDIRMPPSRTDEGIRVAEHCRRTRPATGVILLSQYLEVAYVKVLLSHGTQGRGYLLKERVGDVDDLVSAVRAVADGGTAIDPKVIESLVTGRSRTADAGLARLSPRERQVLAAIAQGHTNATVAADLVLTQHAVEKHINSIFSKLGLTGDQQHHPRVRAALLYLAEGGTSS